MSASINLKILSLYMLWIGELSGATYVAARYISDSMLKKTLSSFSHTKQSTSFLTSFTPLRIVSLI